jgi:hypothetical protein
MFGRGRFVKPAGQQHENHKIPKKILEKSLTDAIMHFTFCKT